MLIPRNPILVSEAPMPPIAYETPAFKERYYEGLSVGIDSDEYFEVGVWGLRSRV